MDSKFSSERLAEAMARACQHWQGERETGAPPAFTVALSREAGTDAPGVARALAERLGWPVYDRELLQRIAAEMGVRASILEGMDERRKGWLQECMEAFTATPLVSQGAYVRRLAETFLALASHGQCILVGRGAAQMLPTATTLRVRLVAPTADRVEAARRRQNLTRDAAARWVAQTDAERTQFVKEHFHKDPDDPRLYDLVLNAARLTAAECADVILAALRLLQGRAAAGRRGLVPV